MKVGQDEKAVNEYVENQERLDKWIDQMRLFK